MNSLNSKDNSSRVNFLGFTKTREKNKKHLLIFSFQHYSKEAIGFVMDIFPFIILQQSLQNIIQN